MDNIDKITEDYEKEHQEREERMDKKFKEAMASIEKGNRTLDKSINSYCKTIKICVTAVMIATIIATIVICGFAIFI